MADEDAGRDFTVEKNDLSAYHGVEPERQTYGTDTEKPLATKEEKKLYKDLTGTRTLPGARNPGEFYEERKAEREERDRQAAQRAAEAAALAAQAVAGQSSDSSSTPPAPPAAPSAPADENKTG